MNAKITFGSTLATVKTSRAAVVPYVLKKDREGNMKLYFLLARDQSSGDITDFGGGVKQNEVSLIASMREFREESDEIFGNLYDRINDFNMTIALLTRTMSVLFVPLHEEWYHKAIPTFNTKRSDKYSCQRKKSHNEVSEIIWFSEDEFRRLLLPKNKEMWKRVQNFYRKNYNDKLSNVLKTVYCY